jgi:hypothetical protein
LLLCLIAPVFAAIARKLVKGQPEWIEPAAAGVVLIFGFLALFKPGRLPLSIKLPMLVWALIQLIYSVLAVFIDWRIALAAIMTRIVPMMMVMVAFSAITQVQDVAKVARVLCLISVTLFPVGMINVIFGHEVLPGVLQPLQSLQELNLALNKGRFYAVTGIFSTPTHLAYFALTTAYLALFCAAAVENENRSSYQWWFAYAISAVLCYMTGRRAVFFCAALGIIFYYYYRKKINMSLILGIMVIIVAMVVVDIHSVIIGKQIESRSASLLELDFQERIFGIFFQEWWLWLQTAPFGNYLGYGGPEASAFGFYPEKWIEVGISQITAECGFLGVLVVCSSFCALYFGMGMKLRKTPFYLQVNLLRLFMTVMLILYLSKSAMNMTQVSTAQLLFWSAPGIGAALLQNSQSSRYQVKSYRSTTRYSQASK